MSFEERKSMSNMTKPAKIQNKISCKVVSQSAVLKLLRNILKISNKTPITIPVTVKAIKQNNCSIFYLFPSQLI